MDRKYFWLIFDFNEKIFHKLKNMAFKSAASYKFCLIFGFFKNTGRKAALKCASQYVKIMR